MMVYNLEKLNYGKTKMMVEIELYNLGWMQYNI